MSKSDDQQISVKSGDGSSKVDAPKGVIPPAAASPPNPSPRAATSAVPNTFILGSTTISTVA